MKEQEAHLLIVMVRMWPGLSGRTLGRESLGGPGYALWVTHTHFLSNPLGRVHLDYIYFSQVKLMPIQETTFSRRSRVPMMPL